MKLRITLLLAVLGAVALALTACGGGGSNAGASSTSTTPASGARNNSAFTKCLSEHGVTLPTGNLNPPSGGDGNPPSGGSPAGGPSGSGGPPPGGFLGGNNSKTQQAFSACRSKLPSGGRGRFGQNSQAFQAYTSCLKDHGVTVPSGPSGASGANPGSFRALQSDPEFAAANKTCQVLLPARNGNTTTTGA